MQKVDNLKVYLIAEPRLRSSAIKDYLEEIGGLRWYEKTIGNVLYESQSLVEFFGRLCYRSWEPGLNKNVTKIREDQGDYLLNILRSGHGSVLEHAMFSFVIHNCSRVLTAELNRHRAGTAISEQSLRYVRLDDLSFRSPPTLSKAAQMEMKDAVTETERVISRIIDREITDDMSFAEKKEKTSAIRRIAPMGLSTELGWSANIRAIRHVIEMRSAPGAEEEIRIFADQLCLLMKKNCPLLFKDYEKQEDGSWQSPYRKV
jgi:thymidylate synthase (FAD)